MAGYDSRVPLSLRDEIPSYDAFRKVDFAGFRVGWMGDYESYLLLFITLIRNPPR